MTLTLIIVAATMAAMASGKIRSDMAAIASLLCLMLTGILTPSEGLSSFSNSVIFVMVGMFIISSAIVRTGLASSLSSKILQVAGKNTNALFMLVMVLTAIIGSLVSNTGTVAIMMPIVVSLSMTIDESPSRFLMPLAFMSSIGGMLTMIGNSSNLVVNDAYVKAGYPTLTLLSFFPVGIVCFLFGIFVLAPFASRYLSRRKNVKTAPKTNRFSMRRLAEKYQISQNMYSLEVGADSEAAGKTLQDLHYPEKYGIVISEVARREPPRPGFTFHHPRTTRLAASADTVLQAGDSLTVIGSVTAVKTMAEDEKLTLAKPGDRNAREDYRYSSVGICELVVMSSSRLVKRTVVESGLRPQFGVTVLGIQRGDKYILDTLRDQVIQAGDALLVQGSWENLSRLEEYSADWVMVGHARERGGAAPLRTRVPLVVAAIVLMLVVTALDILPVVVAVLATAMVLVVGGCFKNMDEVYSAINWETLVMLACLLPISLAMEKTGIVDVIADHMVALCSRHGPYVALAVIYGLASGMNIVISTTPVTLLLTPVAMQVAQALGYEPLPFLIAIATSASMCFASPFSTPSNALVMSAGRYTFADYIKVGLPMQVAMGVVMVAAIPLLYPFAQQ